MLKKIGSAVLAAVLGSFMCVFSVIAAGASTTLYELYLTVPDMQTQDGKSWYVLTRDMPSDSEVLDTLGLSRAEIEQMFEQESIYYNAIKPDTFDEEVVITMQEDENQFNWSGYTDDQFEQIYNQLSSVSAQEQSGASSGSSDNSETSTGSGSESSSASSVDSDSEASDESSMSSDSEASDESSANADSSSNTDVSSDSDTSFDLSEGTVKYDGYSVLNTDQAKWLRLNKTTALGAERVEMIQYTTIINGQHINITLHSYTGSIPSEDEAAFEEMIGGIVFTQVLEKPIEIFGFVLTTQQMYYVIALAGGLVLVIVAVVVLIVLLRKRRKKADEEEWIQETMDPRQHGYTKVEQVPIEQAPDDVFKKPENTDDGSSNS